MPAFVARYQLSGPPPPGWNEQLEKFAADSGLKATASMVGNQAIIQCRVPESSSEQAGAIAKAFFDEAAAPLTGASGGSWVRLVSAEPVERRGIQVVALLKAGLVVLSLPLMMGLLVLGMAALFTAHREVVFPVAVGLTLFFFVVAAVVIGGGAYRDFSKSPDERASERQDQATAEQLVKEIAKNEDPKLTIRIEAARVSLRMRAGRMRRDADQLWQRSVWAYRSAVGFFLLAIAGPTVAATLLLKAVTLDWHVMFGGFGLAAVPLTIGTALLRHDTKLREQYKEAARDVATLERYELALDYARIGPQASYDATLQQVITQLMTLPAANSGTAPAAQGGKEGESDAALTSVATKLVEAVTSTLGQKK